jgi:hypothetical protein
MAYFKVLSHPEPRGAEERHGKSQDCKCSGQHRTLSGIFHCMYGLYNL